MTYRTPSIPAEPAPPLPEWADEWWVLDFDNEGWWDYASYWCERRLFPGCVACTNTVRVMVNLVNH